MRTAKAAGRGGELLCEPSWPIRYVCAIFCQNALNVCTIINTARGMGPRHANVWAMGVGVRYINLRAHNIPVWWRLCAYEHIGTWLAIYRVPRSDGSPLGFSDYQCVRLFKNPSAVALRYSLDVAVLRDAPQRIN